MPPSVYEQGKYRSYQDDPRLRPPEIPRLPDDEGELRKKLAFPKGSIALDGTFSADDGQLYVLEVGNGIGAGVVGIQDLDEKHVSEELRARAKDWNSGTGSWYYSNPDSISAILEDKRRQPPFVPVENRIPTVTKPEDVNPDLFGRSGKIVIKPHDGARGQGVEIFGKEELDQAKDYAERLHNRRGGFVAQPFIKSAGADRAPDDLRGHAASLRLIVPFVMDGEEPQVHVPGFGYQRVARYGPHEVGTQVRGQLITEGDAGVVNRARGAAAVPLSDREREIAHDVANAIIKNLAVHRANAPELPRDVAQELTDRARKVSTDLRDRHRAHITGLSRADEHIGDSVRFTREVERALALVRPNVWEAKTFQRRNDLNFKPVPGSRDAQVQLTDKKGRREWHRFSLEDPRALERMLAGFANQNKPWF